MLHVLSLCSQVLIVSAYVHLMKLNVPFHFCHDFGTGGVIQYKNAIQVYLNSKRKIHVDVLRHTVYLTLWYTGTAVCGWKLGL